MCAVLALSLGSALAAESQTLTKKYDFKDFEALSASGSFQVNLVQDSKWLVEVEYSDFLEEYLDVKVSGDMLHLGLKNLPRSVRESRQYKNGPTLKATVHMPRLNKLSMSGATKLWQQGSFVCKEDFRLDMSGASKVENLSVRAQKARLVLSGSSKNIHMEGSFQQVSLDASGASKCYIKADANQWDVSLSGSAYSQMSGAACQTLTLENSGAAKTDVSIPSETLKYEGTGASSLRAEEAVTGHAVIDLSGASSCRISVKESLEVEATGASECRYKAVGDKPIQTKLNMSRGTKIVSM